MVGLLSCLCFSNIANAQTYDGVNSPWTGTSGECGVACGSTDLIDIRNMTGATQFNIADDQWKNFNLPWEVEMIDGHKVSQGKMYMNGFISFSDQNVLYGGCCEGFRLDEDPLNPPPYWNNWNETMLDYMIAPLWTDLIRGGGSTWYYADDDEAVFGWYEVKEYGQNNTKNTFEIQMNPDGWTFAYDQIEIKNHSIWAGATGDLSEGHVEHLFFHNKGDGDYIWQWDETSNNSYSFLGDTIDCSNPLNDSSCPGYDQAYLDQQCAIDALYDSQCAGYAQAYLDQQCGIDALYDSTCTGYDEAYLAQQCTFDPLYDTECEGYDLAFFDEQCEIDPQSDEGCVGFVWTNITDGEFDPLDEFIPEGVSFGDEEDFYGYEEEEFFGYDEMPMDGSVEDYEDIVFFEPYEEEEVFIFSDPIRDEYLPDALPDLFELEEVMFVEVSEEEFFEILEEEGLEPEEFFEPEEILEDYFRETPLLVEVDEEVVEILLLEEEILEEIEEIVEEEFFEEEIEEIEEIVEEDAVDDIEPAPVRERGERKESKAKKEGRKETAKAVNNAINSAIASGNSTSSNGFYSGGSGGSSGGSAFSGSNSAFSGGISGGGFASSTGDVFLDDIQNFGSITGGSSVTLGELETSNSQAMSSQSQQDDLTGGVDTGVDIPVLSFNLPEVQIDIPDDNQPKTLAEVLAERVAERKEKNQTGVFANQVTILQGMAKATDLSMYYADTYTFESDWYKTESIYKSAKMNDAKSLFRMTNESHGKMRELIRSQY